MWKYQNTDEFYHTNYYKNLAKQSEKELYHSDVYLGKDYSDGIKHFKYIKREKINGKWRYYYKDDKLDALAKSKDYEYDLYKRMDKATKTSINNNHKGDKNDDIVWQNIKERQNIIDRYFKKNKEYKEEKNKSDKRKTRYEKYLIKPLNKASDTIYKGKQKVGTLISKIKNRKTKGKV